MAHWRRWVAICMVVGMLHLTAADVARAGEPIAVPNPAAVKQQVDLFGVGAKVKVRLVDGQKLAGTIRGIENTSFLLTSSKASSTPVAYEQVAQMKFARSTYNSKSHSVDAEEVRRVAVGLGLGRHIMVKTAGGKEYHGNIRAIGSESFTVLPDHQTTPLQVAYNETARLGPNLSTTAKVLIGIGIAIGVWLIIVAAVGPR
jgi:ribosome maturation factor RimP